MTTAPPHLVFQSALFEQQVYGITGAANGIGAATAKGLIRLGARVVVLDLDEQALNRFGREMAEFETSMLLLHGDVADVVFMKDSIAQMHDRWGRVDGWVNNATGLHSAHIEDDTLEGFTQDWRIIVQSAWVAAHELVPLMKARGGSIVNISSILAHKAQATRTAYTSGKSALEGLTRGLAMDLARYNIRVNSICPGAIATRPQLMDADDTASDLAKVKARLFQLSQLGGSALPRIGMADDIANMITYLLSPAALHITGSNIFVDGGYHVDMNHIHDQRRAEMTQEISQLHAELKRLREGEEGAGV